MSKEIITNGVLPQIFQKKRNESQLCWDDYHKQQLAFYGDTRDVQEKALNVFRKEVTEAIKNTRKVINELRQDGDTSFFENDFTHIMQDLLHEMDKVTYPSSKQLSTFISSINEMNREEDGVIRKHWYLI